jgi:hypothetical protein
MSISGPRHKNSESGGYMDKKIFQGGLLVIALAISGCSQREDFYERGRLGEIPPDSPGMENAVDSVIPPGTDMREVPRDPATELMQDHPEIERSPLDEGEDPSNSGRRGA